MRFAHLITFLLLIHMSAARAVERVEFSSSGETIAGDLYWPNQTRPIKGFPAVILIGPIGTTQNQIVDRYARMLAEKGIAALTFDPRYFGKSGGRPRQQEKPEAKVQDFIRAVDFLVNESGIDSRNIFAGGICCGGTVALKATALDSRIRGLVSVTSCPQNLDSWKAMLGAKKIDRRMLESAAAMTSYSIFGRVESVPIGGLDAPKSDYGVITGQRMSEYYGSEAHGITQLINNVATMTVQNFFKFDAIESLKVLNQPAIFIFGDRARHRCPHIVKSLQSVQSPLTITVIKGADIVDFYKDETVIKAAVDKVSLWIQDLVSK